MKGFSRADLNRQPLKPDSINEKSAGCIDTHHRGCKKHLSLRLTEIIHGDCRRRRLPVAPTTQAECRSMATFPSPLPKGGGAFCSSSRYQSGRSVRRRGCRCRLGFSDCGASAPDNALPICLLRLALTGRSYLILDSDRTRTSATYARPERARPRSGRSSSSRSARRGDSCSLCASFEQKRPR
jgi:hypothetical protein